MPEPPPKGRKPSPETDDADPESIDIKTKMLRDMQEEIRLEQFNDMQGAEMDAEEATVRAKQLQETRDVLSRHWAAYTEDALNFEAQENWDRYMTCDGLPDPGSLSDMNTFLYLWSTKNEEATMNGMEEKCRIVTHVIFIKYYSIDDNPTREDAIQMSFYYPIGRKSIEVQFDEMELSIKMPSDMDCYRMAIRGLWLAYDHYSVRANSYRMPELPEHLTNLWDPSLDLLDFAVREYEEIVRIREEQAEERKLRLEEKKAILEKMEHPTLSPRLDRKRRRGRIARKPQTPQAELENILSAVIPSKAQMLPYLPTPKEVVRHKEEDSRLEIRRVLFTRCEITEVNLRKYRILGGVFHVDLLYQPPQPKDLGQDTQLTTLELPKEPKFVPFVRTYETPQPAPDAERTPEVIEAEMKALEQAMDALVLINLKLPESVLWFEPPMIAHWIPEKNMWSTKYVHDVKYNEEKQTIAFRTGRLGIHGLAVYKFANLPFQSWEMKPETGKAGREHGGVVLTITAATVQAEFVTREDRVCLNSFTGTGSGPLKGILGEYMELESLIVRLQQVGCDLFPERDAASYLKGFSMKHPFAEKHLRNCMALLSTSYVFSWSRWNAARDFRDIILLFKEVHGCVAKERTSLTLLVSPSRTMRIRCTEVSPEFSDLPLEEEDDTKFYADLYQLALHTAGIKTRLLMERISYKLVATITRLLERTNVINMSS
ncbi:protein CASC1-like [Ceratina calcarata]|uniref:Protein CASC1-like n=1 Tax=Ceratina calcarata TaxID=156304 RepID=A0AAJ7WAE7_9HYME|nr:protein CASC1-like [Ceratina calcarata]